MARKSTKTNKTRDADTSLGPLLENLDAYALSDHEWETDESLPKPRYYITRKGHQIGRACGNLDSDNRIWIAPGVVLDWHDGLELIMQPVGDHTSTRRSKRRG